MDKKLTLQACRTVAGHIVLFLNPFWEITIESGVLDRLYTSLTFFPGPILLCKSASVRRPALSGWPRQRWRPTISIKQTDRLWSLVSKPRQPGGRADGRTDAPRLSFVVRPSVCLSVVARAPRRDPSFPPSPRPPSVQCCSAAAFFFLPRERERERILSSRINFAGAARTPRSSDPPTLVLMRADSPSHDFWGSSFGLAIVIRVRHVSITPRSPARPAPSLARRSSLLPPTII